MDDIQRRGGRYGFRWLSAYRFNILSSLGALLLGLGLFLARPVARAADYACTASFSGTPPAAGTFATAGNFDVAWGAAINAGWKVDTGLCFNGAPNTSGTTTFTINGRTSSVAPASGTFYASYSALVCVPAGVANPCFTPSQYSGAGGMSGGPYTISPPASSGGSSSGGSSSSSSGGTTSSAPPGTVAASDYCAGVQSSSNGVDRVNSSYDCTVALGDYATLHYTSQNATSMIFQEDSHVLPVSSSLDGTINFAPSTIGDHHFIVAAAYKNNGWVWAPSSDWVTIHVVAPPPPPATSGTIFDATGNICPSDTGRAINVDLGNTNGIWQVIDNTTGTVVATGQAISGYTGHFSYYASSPPPSVRTLTLESSTGTVLDTAKITITQNNCPSVALSVNGQHPDKSHPLTVGYDSTISLARTVSQASTCYAYTSLIGDYLGQHPGLLSKQWDGSVSPSDATISVTHVKPDGSGLNGYYFTLMCYSSGFSESASDSVYITVVPAQPKISCSATSASSGSPTTLTASYSSPDNSRAERYQWDFGDNSSKVGLVTPSISPPPSAQAALAAVPPRISSVNESTGENRTSLIPRALAAAAQASPSGYDASLQSFVYNGTDNTQSVSPPATINEHGSQRLYFTVQFMNTGANSWYANYYNDFPKVNIVNSPAGLSSSVSFHNTNTSAYIYPQGSGPGAADIGEATIEILLPNTDATFTFTIQMARNGVAFGQATTPITVHVTTIAEALGYAATMSSPGLTEITSGTVGNPNTTYPVTITVKNTGHATWRPYSSYISFGLTADAGSILYQSGLGGGELYNDNPSASVPPGGDATYSGVMSVAGSGPFKLNYSLVISGVGDVVQGSSPLTVSANPLNSVTHTYATAGNYTVTVTAFSTTGGQGTAACQAVVQDAVVQPKPTVTLDIDRSSIVPGDAAKLTWSSTNATSVTKTVGFTTNLVAGSATVTPTIGPSDTNVTFSITVQGPGGTATASKTIAVQLPATPTSSPPSASSFQGAFAANKIQIDRASPLDIIYDPTVQESPPPGFAKIIPPQTSEQ